MLTKAKRAKIQGKWGENSKRANKVHIGIKHSVLTPSGVIFTMCEAAGADGACSIWPQSIVPRYQIQHAGHGVGHTFTE